MDKQIIKKYNAFGMAPLGEMPLYLILEYKLFLFQYKYLRPFNLGFNAFVNHFFKDLKELKLTQKQFLNTMNYLKEIGHIKIEEMNGSKFKNYSLTDNRYRTWLKLGKAIKETVTNNLAKAKYDPEMTEEDIKHYNQLIANLHSRS